MPLEQSIHDYETIDVGPSFMNLTNVVQNNLGGAGPDSGAELELSGTDQRTPTPQCTNDALGLANLRSRNIGSLPYPPETCLIGTF